MKKSVKITGLDCPNCARNLQNQINKIDGVKNCEIDFVHSKLTYESDNLETSLSEIRKLTKQLEPDAKIENKEKNSKKTQKKLIFDVFFIIFGIFLAILCCFVAKTTWLKITLFCLSAVVLGYKTYIKAFKLLLKGTINENMLVTISVVGAGIINETMEALMVIALYSIGKIFEGIAIEKSKKSIEELINIQPAFATIIKDGKEVQVLPEEVNIGDIIIVRAGEKVALDGIIIDGSANIDMQSLTGESLPVLKTIDEQILSGSIVLDGVLNIKVETEYKNSTVKKIMDLIETAQDKKSKTETVISKISKWYTLGVICFASIVFLIVMLITKNINISFYRAFSMLVISCPCAFAISVPLTYFSGIGNASKHNILVKGSNYLDILSKINTVIFDKTGTITTGKFKVEEIITNSNYSQSEILKLCAIGEKNSLHPIAKSIVDEYLKNYNNIENATEVKEIAGEGVYYSYNSNSYFIGKRKGDGEKSCVEIYENDILIGSILLSDEIKQTSINAISKLNNMNIKTVMLTGDNATVAKDVASKVGIKEFESNLLPQDKFSYIQNLKENNKNVVAYVGDGINDAPSLSLSDVGISMGITGSSASIEASDVVLVKDDLESIITAIKISKKTHKIVWQNILFSGAIKITFLIFGALGITGMAYAVFADVGVTLLAILNSLRALKLK